MGSNFWRKLAKRTRYHGRIYPLCYLLYLHPRIEFVPQKVSEDVEANHRNADGEAGEDNHPGRRVDLRSVQADHRAPGGGGRLHTEAEERQRGFEQDEPADAQTACHKDQRERVRKYMSV